MTQVKATVGGTDGGAVDATVGSTVRGCVRESESQCESKREDLPVIVERLFAAVSCSLGVEPMSCGHEPLSGAASASRYGAEPLQ
ncbi:MAG: hypothetical protein OWU32_03420 [Firmicutes bacterium]|nr:hypothetical protein [Bacillota bacterium]